MGMYSDYSVSALIAERYGIRAEEGEAGATDYSVQTTSTGLITSETRL